MHRAALSLSTTLALKNRLGGQGAHAWEMQHSAFYTAHRSFLPHHKTPYTFSVGAAVLRYLLPLHEILPAPGGAIL
jgi:hypothetical protein